MSEIYPYMGEFHYICTILNYSYIMCIPKSAAAFMAAAIFCMAFSFTVSAQQGTPDTGDGKSFSSQNWYISASVGEQWLLKGSQNGWHFVGKLNAGTWFDSWNGIKINAQGGSRKLAGNSSALYFSTGVDYTLNLLRIFGDYETDTPFNFSLSAGPAYNIINYPGKNCKYTHTVSINLGLNAGYDFSPHWGIFGEIMSYGMDRFYKDSGIPVFFRFDWTVGLRYRFTRHAYSTSRAQKTAAAINDLKANMEALERSMSEAEEKESSRVIIAPEDVAASVDIYFDEYSSFISNEQRKKIDAIGSWMKENPGFSVNIIIFSDGKYGSKADEILRNSRADVIRDLLTGQYGITEDRIQSFGSEEAGYKNLSGCNAKIIFSR